MKSTKNKEREGKRRKRKEREVERKKERNKKVVGFDKSLSFIFFPPVLLVLSSYICVKSLMRTQQRKNIRKWERSLVQESMTSQYSSCCLFLRTAVCAVHVDV